MYFFHVFICRQNAWQRDTCQGMGLSGQSDKTTVLAWENIIQGKRQVGLIIQ
jgi:hypothetical protein